jgi:hypothetical protein
MIEPMEFTGERFTPGVHGNIELEHLHRYLAASELATDRVVLDIASGGPLRIRNLKYVKH